MPTSDTFVIREMCVPFSMYLSTRTVDKFSIMMSFPTASRTTEVMPKVWLDLGQTYKACNQPIWAGVGIWRCEEVWSGWWKGRSLSVAPGHS